MPYSFFQQIFCRISEGLGKVDATTLDALQLHQPNPPTIYTDNIYYVKACIRPFLSMFSKSWDPIFFSLTKNGKGEVKMVDHPLVGGENQEWLSEEHHVIMSKMRLGIQWLLKPDTTLLKNATHEVMESQCQGT